MKKLLLISFLTLAVGGSAFADEHQEWAHALGSALGRLPSEAESRAYPQQFAVIAILTVPNVPAPAPITNPRLADVLSLVRARRAHWQAVLDGVPAERARGEDPMRRLDLKAEIADAVVKDADADLAYLADLPKMAYDSRVQKRLDDKSALLAFLRAKTALMAFEWNR
ncbi:MAG: hypothetical protein HY078_09440 [Elusimicrobia bacterium]|nr:hypothetical protein [Elusimicrobiota bacterium]